MCNEVKWESMCQIFTCRTRIDKAMSVLSSSNILCQQRSVHIDPTLRSSIGAFYCRLVMTTVQLAMIILFV